MGRIFSGVQARAGRLAITTALMLTGAVVVAPAARATDVPAYGIITISDAGAGLHVTWTYDEVMGCSYTTSGPGGLPQEVTVSCYAGQSITTFNCPNMVLTTTTNGGGIAGGRASCGGTFDTGVVVNSTASRSGNLGHVYDFIECVAYVDSGVLIAPYTVTCNEPGLPTL
jgi:hypothetical protein